MATETRPAHPSLAWAVAGTMIGSLAALVWLEKNKNRTIRRTGECGRSYYERLLVDKRERLPPLILLLRHGESEGNADHTLWRSKPDNLISLTPAGAAQARAAGRRIEDLFQLYEEKTGRPIQRVHIHVSPFERTLQTALEARKFFEHRVVRTSPESRLREQEFGNFSEKDSALYREEQKKVGRFFYRFPTGESGCDVLDRVKSWWSDSFLTLNERVGYDPVDAVVVVTHGLTMRFLLMQLYNWSPTTFHSVWNAGNCDLYVLNKDLSKPGISPYVLDEESGDMPESSIDVLVTLSQRSASTGEVVQVKRHFKLHDYLGVPPPRTTQTQVIKERLMEQFSQQIFHVDEIVDISFKPFIDGGVTIKASTEDWHRAQLFSNSTAGEMADQGGLVTEGQQGDGIDDVARVFKGAIPEMSYRWPCKYSGT